VDQFLNDFKAEDYSSFDDSFTPRFQRCIDVNDFEKLDTHPVMWILDEMDEYSSKDEFSDMYGRAVFSDGAELLLHVRMECSGRKWLIDGFWFGADGEARLNYSHYYCGE